MHKKFLKKLIDWFIQAKVIPTTSDEVKKFNAIARAKTSSDVQTVEGKKIKTGAGKECKYLLSMLLGKSVSTY